MALLRMFDMNLRYPEPRDEFHHSPDRKTFIRYMPVNARWQWEVWFEGVHDSTHMGRGTAREHMEKLKRRER